MWFPLITGFEQYLSDGIVLLKWKRCPETTMARLGILAPCKKIPYRQYFLLGTICQYPFSKYPIPTKQPTDLTQPYSTHAEAAMIFVSCVLTHLFQQSTFWNFRPGSSSGNHVRLTNLQGPASLRQRGPLRVSAKNQLQIRTLKV